MTKKLIYQNTIFSILSIVTYLLMYNTILTPIGRPVMAGLFILGNLVLWVEKDLLPFGRKIFIILLAIVIILLLLV